MKRPGGLRSGRPVAAAATLFLLLVGGAPAWAAWPLVWDFDSRSDEPVAAALGAGGDLWVLSESNLQGQAQPRGVLLRLDGDGGIVWATDDPMLTAPLALALRADGTALAIGRVGATLQLTAFGADGEIAWRRTREGLAADFPFTGPSSSPIWDDVSAVWRIPAGVSGAFAVLSFAADGEPLPDLLWSPPGGDARATSVLPRAGGGLLVAGIVEEVAVPGWWVVALDTGGLPDWSRFEDGETVAGAFSGAFLLSADPVRVWADDETHCGLFSLRLWALDAAAGTPLWDATWPTDGFPGCESFTPDSVTLAGGRIVAAGSANVPASGASFDAVVVALDAATGGLEWVRVFAGATTAIRGEIASRDGGALLATTLFPNPNPGPTPLWFAGWDRGGTPCAPPLELLPARIQSSFALPDNALLLVGNAFSFGGGTSDDLIVQRIDNPCPALFADGFETGDPSAWLLGPP